MSDYDGNFMDDLSPLSSPGIRDVLAMLDQNNNGRNPISETFPQTNLSTNPQPEQRSGGLHNRMAARLGFAIPPLEIESISPLVHSPILVISPGFSSLSPFLQSPNMISNSSSEVIPRCPIPNGAPTEAVESSGAADATMIISNINLPHHPQGGNRFSNVSSLFPVSIFRILLLFFTCETGSDDIPREKPFYITSHESNAGVIGASLVPSCDSEVVAETDIMNLISLENGSEDDDKDIEYNQEEDKVKDHNVVVEPPSKKRFQVNIE
ncbi:hypothetical protein N665_5110s0001 [Sinapis alba]|nr:hypothetical protein N665_5110s0001 [Sinapis alba]